MASPIRAEMDLCANALCSSSEIALILRVVVEAVCILSCYACRRPNPTEPCAPCAGTIHESRRCGMFTQVGKMTASRQLHRLRVSVGVQSSEERQAGRFLLALDETGMGGGDTCRRIHLVCAHRSLGIGVRRDYFDAAAPLAQALDLALQVRAR